MVKRIVTEDEFSMAAQVVGLLAPNELHLLDEITRKPGIFSRLRNDSVGFGLDFPIDALSPAVMILTSWALGVIQGSIDDALKDRLKRMTVHLWTSRRGVEPPPQPAGLTDAEILSGLENYAVALGVDGAKASEVSQAIVALLRHGAP